MIRAETLPIPEEVVERMKRVLEPYLHEHLTPQARDEAARAALAAIGPEFVALRQSASEAAEKATAWQDIATAPKDGTPIVLITVDRFGVQRALTTQWQNHMSGGEGWAIFLGGTKPTYWAHLPSPLIATAIEKEPG